MEAQGEDMHLFIPNRIRYNLTDVDKKEEEKKFKEKAFKMDEQFMVEEAVTYDKLMAHIRKKHTRDVVGHKYPCCVPLG